MLKRSLVAKVLPGFAVSGVLIASIVASPVGLFGSLSGYGYGVCGYGYNAFGGTATVTGLSPTSGTTAGGTSVFITGSGYCNTVSAVHFGASPLATLVAWPSLAFSLIRLGRTVSSSIEGCMRKCAQRCNLASLVE